MDSDDAVDVLEQMEASAKEKIVKLLDADSSHDIHLILSYDEDEIGSLITTNFVCISKNLSIRQAMRELVRQAGENDNISTIYVVDASDTFCGAIDLKDLIVAREHDELDDLIQEKLVGLMDEESSHDIKMIQSYEDDEIGSQMTTNFIMIHRNLSIRQAMRELVRQAGENDNIGTVYVEDGQNHFYGAIDLKDLIVARENDSLEDIISTSYPYVTDHEKISDCIERIKDYAEDSIPVLDSEGQILGVITSQDIVEVVDDEMGEDYAKLAGLTAEEDLNETTKESIKKRLPWLLILLFMGMGVSSVVGIFETVVAVLPIVMCFQSLILDMAGNVGTQSLAVTIRVLMDENLTGKEKLHLVFKEMKVGFLNGMILGVMAFVFIGIYACTLKGNPTAHAFLISGCVGFALMLSMVISSMVGTMVPMFFHKIKVDPAVASGPLITTVNDLVAVVTYYGLVWLLLIEMLHLA